MTLNDSEHKSPSKLPIKHAQQSPKLSDLKPPEQSNLNISFILFVQHLYAFQFNHMCQSNPLFQKSFLLTPCMTQMITMYAQHSFTASKPQKTALDMLKLMIEVISSAILLQQVRLECKQPILAQTTSHRSKT